MVATPPGATQRLRAMAERLQRDVLFAAAEYGSLLEQYGESWIAVQDARVVAVAARLDELLSSLQARNIAPRDVFIDILSKDSHIKL